MANRKNSVKRNSRVNVSKKPVVKYSTPERYFFPLHHPRPRFKNYVEDVLGYVSFGIADIGQMPKKLFNAALEEHIRHYGANLRATPKTISNWRTEIGAIFGLYIEGRDSCRPAFQCEDLAINTNLPRFFRGVMSAFQYPAGCIRSDEVVKIVKANIRFKPGRWLAEYFLRPGSPTLTKEEFCHCVLNDLRVTRDHEPMEKTVKRIEDNRAAGVKYVSKGDVVRYAGDILDYMYLAAFLDKDSKDRFSARSDSLKILGELKKVDGLFDRYYDQRKLSTRGAKDLEYDWFVYLENEYKKFVAVMDNLKAPSTVSEVKHASSLAEGEVPEAADTETIGKEGENLALRHEMLRVENEGRPDLVHLIKQIPTKLAAGYDIKSIEADTEADRYIEVKTCVSRKRVKFNNFHLTPNEWRVADTHGDSYYVYRIAIDDEGVQMFVIQNPVQKFRERLIRLSFHHSVQLNFTENSGQFTELLCAN